MHQISVFEPQQIGGRWVNPICLPIDNDTISRSVCASVNLIWFSLNIASYQEDTKECGRLALMCKALLTIEHRGLSITDDDELQEALDKIQDLADSQGDDYDDEEINNEDE